MPYQTEVYQPPPLPPALITQSRTFDDLRMKVSGIVNYLQQLNSSDITYFQHLRENINQNTTTEGHTIPVASTIQVYKFMHVLSGNGAVQTIIPPLGISGQLMLVSQDGFELVAGGNISMIQSPNVLPPGAHILLTWIPSKQTWYADSCRLQGQAGGGGSGTGNGVLVTPALAGPGIHIDPSTYIISNIGVLSLIAGTGISLSGATGNVTVSATGGGGGSGPQPYDLGSMINGQPTASMVILRYPFPRPVNFPSGLTNSQGVAGTAATASTTFNIQKNGTTVGTMVFAASATTATFTMASATSFAMGDVMTVVAPATPDTTLANLGFSITGTR